MIAVDTRLVRACDMSTDHWAAFLKDKARMQYQMTLEYASSLHLLVPIGAQLTTRLALAMSAGRHSAERTEVVLQCRKAPVLFFQNSKLGLLEIQ